jgi:16S rRNA (uracil1498-N3)-methyltransferase
MNQKDIYPYCLPCSNTQLNAMTPFFFSNATENEAFLEGEEARHCLKVMRNKTGDRVLGIDGKGWMYLGKILEISKKGVRLEILEREENWGEKPAQIYLLVSPLHKADRFEWLVEKATELGVTHVVPYLAKHTVKTGLRLDRLERIMESAVKQCLRSRTPTISEPVMLEEALQELPQGGIRLIAHAPTGVPMSSLEMGWDQAGTVVLLLGPEGDFAEDELDMCSAAGFSPVSLGNNRLRSETAAIHLMGLVKDRIGY